MCLKKKSEVMLPTDCAPLLKRISYAHEKEVRAFIYAGEHQTIRARRNRLLGSSGDVLLTGENEHAPTGEINPNLALGGIEIHLVVAHGVDAAVDGRLGVENFKPGAAISGEA